MGKAKRRAQAAAASITVEHRHTAARINTRMQELEAARLDEVEILSRMTDYTDDFYCLITSMDNMALDMLCREFAGLHCYRTIVETVAKGIASGQSSAPGDRKIGEEHRLAAAINLRVHQLEAQGVSDRVLMEQMIGYIPDLERLWSATSDEQLAFLLRCYPGLYRYGMLMEEATVAEKQNTSFPLGPPPALPDSVKATVSSLLADGSTLERGFQAVIDAWPERPTEAELLGRTHQRWTALLAALPVQLEATSVPEESRAVMEKIFSSMAQRIEHLHRQVGSL
ncbi:hypothetical protein V4C53_44195 [Paraburkholderia azotifigens]|uniref:hypothetical protein n=1 Tax=Paraburkholderia azotifigens TaxID=2057004 RepID=UPI003174A8BD